MSYFVIMIDYGRRGLEAIVHPEMTRRGAVEKVREIIGDGHDIPFIHYINGLSVEDVTEELIDEAKALKLEAAE